MPDRPLKLALVGATGAVGRAVLEDLEAREVPVAEVRLFASGRSRDELVEFRGDELEVEVLSENGILAGYPDRIQVWASHMDEVREVPPGYSVLARSRIARVEAIASEEEKIYGVQWHPEVSHTVNGRLVFQNFDRICREGEEG